VQVGGDTSVIEHIPRRGVGDQWVVVEIVKAPVRVGVQLLEVGQTRATFTN